MTYKEWFKKVTKTNAAFKKANKARRSVMLAKDIIEACNTKLFNTPGDCNYFEVSKSYNDEKDLRDYLIKDNPKCDLCAKGSILACYVMRNDKVKCDVIYSSLRFEGANLSKLLDGLFSKEQLNLI